MFVKRVGDEGFAGFQGQSHRCQPLFRQFTRGLERGKVFAQNDEIVRKANDHQSVPFGGGRNDGFKAVQSDVGKQG